MGEDGIEEAWADYPLRPKPKTRPEPVQTSVSLRTQSPFTGIYSIDHANYPIAFPLKTSVSQRRKSGRRTKRKPAQKDMQKLQRDMQKKDQSRIGFMTLLDAYARPLKTVETLISEYIRRDQDPNFIFVEPKVEQVEPEVKQVEPKRKQNKEEREFHIASYDSGIRFEATKKTNQIIANELSQVFATKFAGNQGAQEALNLFVAYTLDTTVDTKAFNHFKTDLQQQASSEVAPFLEQQATNMMKNYGPGLALSLVAGGFTCGLTGPAAPGCYAGIVVPYLTKSLATEVAVQAAVASGQISEYNARRVAAAVHLTKAAINVGNTYYAGLEAGSGISNAVMAGEGGIPATSDGFLVDAVTTGGDGADGIVEAFMTGGDGADVGSNVFPPMRDWTELNLPADGGEFALPAQVQNSIDIIKAVNDGAGAQIPTATFDRAIHTIAEFPGETLHQTLKLSPHDPSMFIGFNRVVKLPQSAVDWIESNPKFMEEVQKCLEPLVSQVPRSSVSVGQLRQCVEDVKYITPDLRVV